MIYKCQRGLDNVDQFSSAKTNTFFRLCLGYGSIVLILPILCSSPLKAEPQNQSEQEKTIMTHGSGNNIPPLDLQVPAVTETATFALG